MSKKGWYRAMAASVFSLMVSSKNSAIFRIDSTIFVGPKKLNSVHGVPYRSSIVVAM